jgi:hypothetical protein
LTSNLYQATGYLKCERCHSFWDISALYRSRGMSLGFCLKTAVRIPRGRHASREGWISGTLTDRLARGITKAMVKFEDEEPELLANRR